MEPRYHVLLIGIDAYNGGGSLNGCVNDIDLIQRLLIDRVGLEPTRVKRLAAPRFQTQHETDVPEEKPTRDNILAAFKALAADGVAPDDRVFIYYSGHGAQVPVVTEDGDRFFREALVPTDHVVDGERRYVFDWEINALLADISVRTTSVTFILDCCNSAGATRGDFQLPDPNTQERFLEPDMPYKLSAEESRAAAGERGLRSGILRSVQACQVVAACLDDERARESEGKEVGGRRQGELTRAFVRRVVAASQLPKPLIDLRWGEIWRPLAADVVGANSVQNPWISGDFARRVFGGPPEDGDTGFGVTKDGDAYRLDVGLLAEVTKDARIAVYGSTPSRFPPVDSAAERAERVGVLRVTRAERASARAVAEGPGFELPSGARGRLIALGEAARLRVALDPPDAAIEAQIKKSELLEMAEGGPGDVTLVRRADGAWVLTDDVFGSGDKPGDPVLVVIPSNRLNRVGAVLEHYYDYSKPRRMATNCADLPGRLVFKLLDCTGKDLTPAEAQMPKLKEVAPGAHANYEFAEGTPVCFRVDNTSSDDLRVTLIDCQPDGTVCILGEASVGAGSSHVFYQDDTLATPFTASLPDGMTVGVDRIVVIGTTSRTASLHFLKVNYTFAVVLLGTFRNFGAPERTEKWTATVSTIRVVK